jgi:ferredoxin-nitrite reductase
MSTLDEILLNEIPDFRNWGHKFINNEINTLEFKGKSGGMGVYAQRGGKSFMIRLKAPGGIVSKDFLEAVHYFTEKYNLETVHLTTRQAVQLHDLNIDAVCDIMEECIKRGIYTRGTGGNFPRNVAMSPLTGVDPAEAFDVAPYAMAVNQHFQNKIYSYKLIAPQLI